MHNEQNYRSPIIREVKPTEERLIDTGMLHFESSVAGFNERYHRGETSHTIHVWWARRPHSAMRSLVFSSVCKDKSNYALQVMADLAMQCDLANIETAKNLVASGYNNAPKLLDMFGGGGTIAFEAKRLGIDTYSIDSNELSVFIQKCNLLYADNINLDDGIRTVEKVGSQVLNNLKKRSDWLYPLRKKENEKVFGYIWTYKQTCPHCGFKFLISKRPWLAKRENKHIAFTNDSFNEEKEEKVEIKEAIDDDDVFNSHWEKHSYILHCPKCNSSIKSVNVNECEDVMTALIINEKGKGKKYLNAKQQEAIPPEEQITKEEKKILKHLNASLPHSRLPVWSGIVNPALYGIQTHADVLNKRQRLFLLYLIDELETQYEELLKINDDIAKFVIGALSSLIDQVIDWNCRLSMWIPQNEQVGRGFCGPGIAMLFDYAETDQVLHGPANLWDKLQRIVNGLKTFKNCQGKVTVELACAQQLPFESNYFDAIVTDPPYYDNVYYSVLADFFYSWKRILLKKIEPELFEKETTSYRSELVSSAKRVDEGVSAHEEYCKNLCMAFNEAARVIKKDGVFTFIYSHSSVNGWEAVVRAYRQSDFFISSVQPLSIERKSRPRSMLSQAINTCVAIVARKSIEKKVPISFDEISEKATEYCEKFGQLLVEQSGWTESDAGLAVLASTIGLMCNSSEIIGGKDTDAILQVATIVSKFFPEFKIKVRGSL